VRSSKLAFSKLMRQNLIERHTFAVGITSFDETQTPTRAAKTMIRRHLKETMRNTFTKRLGILRKRDDMTHEQFVDHWFNQHAALCMQIPNLRRYSVNLVDRTRFPHFDYDGFSELWFDSEEEMVASLESPQGKTLLADLPNFVKDIKPIVTVETQIIWP
jgi:uncharacterized protein (TIGR02118 family)